MTRVGVGCKRRLDDVDAKRARARKIEERGILRDLDERKAAVAAALCAARRPFRDFPVLDGWKEQYTRDDFRYKFLVIVGCTRSGKTQLARGLFPNPFVDVVEDSDLPCLDGLVVAGPGRHGALVFDNVNMDAFVLRSRALFQASAETVTLGKSKARQTQSALCSWPRGV